MPNGWDDHDRREKALERLIARCAQPELLTRHELAVVFLSSHGVEHEQAAEWLHLSPHTVRQYAKSAKAKLGARGVHPAHTVATALRLGLID